MNRDWAAQQLTDFIAHTTKPVPGTTGQLMQITPGQKHQLAQVVEQILDRVLPDWRGLPNHPGSDGYNKGILMSTDTDLKPALEAIETLARGRVTPRAEVAAWSGNALRRRISTGGNKPYCHWLDKATYAAVCDPTDYSDSAWS